MHRGTKGLRPALRDEQEERPVCRCPGCGGEVYAGEWLTEWEGRFLCPDCFANRLESWLNLAPNEVAAALGLDRKRAETGGE